MGALLIGVICLLMIGITCFRGYRRGFLRTAFSMVSLIVSYALVSVISPYMHTMLNATPMPKAIYNSVSHNMENTIEDFLPDMNSVEETAGEGTDIDLTTIPLTEEQQKQWMTVSNIPQWVQKNVVQQTEQTMDQMIDGVSQYIADILTNLIAYVFTFLVIFFLIQGISFMLGIVNHIPIIGGVNRKLGAVLGVLQGLAILWILCLILTIFAPSEWGGNLIAIIEGNPVLAWVYHMMIGMGQK